MVLVSTVVTQISGKVFYKTTKINLHWLHELIFVARIENYCKKYTIYGKANSDQAG